jgi:peptide/nickel transport system substrate-binding protein
VLEGNGGALNFLGQTGDFADADNFIGIFFQGQKPQWGFNNPELFKALDEAEVEPDVDKRKAMYEDINKLIMDYLPGIPYAHSKSALGFSAKVKGYVPSPTTNESFANVTIDE